MDFTVTFIKYFWFGIQFISPILLLLLFFIILLGHIVGRLEGWSKIDTIYYSFITATTVGYGDFPPSHSRSKLFAVLIAFFGLLLSGIIVAIAINALSVSFKDTGRDKIIMKMHKSTNEIAESESADKIRKK
jgi:voltage-gated potassium channel